MTYEDLCRVARDSGFSVWAPLDPKHIELKSNIRQMCAKNTCGQYAKRWSCPPACESFEALSARLSGYSSGILVQSVGSMDDAFDFEKMMEIERCHKRHFNDMYACLRKSELHPLAIGSGCCTVCTQCTYPDAPCRYPERMISSMEAYGLAVMDVCKSCGVQYHLGSEKIAYTSLFLI